MTIPFLSHRPRKAAGPLALLGLSLLLCAAPAAGAADLVSPGGTDKDRSGLADGYEALAIKYVEIGQETADETREWKQNRILMLREKELLEKEKALLAKQIAALEKELTAGEEDRLSMLKRQEAGKNTLAAYSAAADLGAKALGDWKKRIPESLAASACTRLFALLGRAKADANVPQRLETVLSLYREIEIILNSSALVREVLTDEDGRRQEYNVLYLGLSAAYALSDDASRAAVGFPPDRSGANWRWSWKDAPARAIAAAMRQHKHETKADFVNLPLQGLVGAGKGADDE